MIEIIGMRDHERHSSALLQKVRLPDPSRLIHMPQDYEQRVILGKGHGELHEVTIEEGKPGATPTRLRLVRVGIGIRGVIVESQERHPVPVPLRCGGAEAPRTPPACVIPHRRQSSTKHLEGLQISAVVVKPVNANLKAPPRELVNEVVRGLIALGTRFHEDR